MKVGVVSWAMMVAAALACAGSALAETRARVRMASEGEGVRAEIRLTAPATTKTFAISGDKPRFVVDFDQPVAFDGRAAGSGPGSGPVLGYRFAPRGEGSRLVFDLAANGVKAGATTGSDGAVTLRFSAAPTSATATSYVPPAAVAEVPPAPPPALTPPTRRSERKVVVIDAGHGGKDPGALGVTGAHEKDVTLAAALVLRDRLEARGFAVVLTRDGDEFLALPERLRRARAAKADLFISLHADSSPNASAQGASIYTLSERGGQRAKSLANANDWELELAERPKTAAAEDILMDLAQRETKNRSAEFAQIAVRKLNPVTPLLQNTHRNAGFFVLLAPDVPAILLEMGFMTNATDEKRLTNARARREMMDALAQAVETFFEPPTTLASVQ